MSGPGEPCDHGRTGYCWDCDDEANGDAGRPEPDPQDVEDGYDAFEAMVRCYE